MNKLKFTDLSVLMILHHKDEMIELGIIPEDIKWSEITPEQEEKVKRFLKEKIETRKGEDKYDDK